MNNFWSDYYDSYEFNELNILNELERALHTGNDLISFKLVRNLNKNKIAMKLIEILEI